MPGSAASIPEEAPVLDGSRFAAAADDVTDVKAVPIVDDPSALLSDETKKKVRVLLPPETTTII